MHLAIGFASDILLPPAGEWDAQPYFPIIVDSIRTETPV